MGWNDLNTFSKARIMQLAVNSGITDLRAIRDAYNSYAEGGPLSKEEKTKLINRINSTSKADFVERLKDPNRKTISYGDGVATHRLAYATDDTGTAIVYPEVQSYENTLKEFVGRDAIERAIERRDTLNMSIREADWFTKHYKEYYPGFNSYKNGGKKKLPLVAPKRVRQNDSPTSEASTKLEDQMNRWVYETIGKRGPNPDYIIPYLKDKEIKVRGVGRVPTNALDSLAKYANKTKLPLSEALGLAAQETAFGAQPYYNYDSKVDGETISSRALGNSSYFRNFGAIPAENLVRDFRYNKPDWKGEYIDSTIPPLQHAFEYYKKGDYNRGDPNHTKDVRAKGKALMSDPAIQKWMKESKYVKKQ